MWHEEQNPDRRHYLTIDSGLSNRDVVRRTPRYEVGVSQATSTTVAEALSPTTVLQELCSGHVQGWM